MSAKAQSSPLQTLSSSLADLVDRASAGVVAVHSTNARSSGFAWREGYIVTAEGALADDGEISVAGKDGAQIPARLVGRDPTTDVALLAVERAGLTPISLSSEAPRLGALAIVLGGGAGGATAALGVISVAGPQWRSLRGGLIDARLELDASLRRASEGGLALDAAGGAFGMAVFGPRRRPIVIPMATIDRAAERLKIHGRVARGYLGLGLQPVRLDSGGLGAMAMSVEAGGPGAAAGVRQGDVIVAWDGQAIGGVRSILGALGPDSVGSTVKLALLRGGAPVDAALTIGERPVSR